MRRALIGLILPALLGPGCSTDRDPRDLLAPRDVGTIIVDARLIVGRAMPMIRLRTTQSPNEPYDDRNAALNGAVIEVYASTGDTIRYVPDDLLGRYVPWPTPPTYILPSVLPNTTYRLYVRAPDGRVVTAETTTPAPFRVREWLLLDDPTLTVRRELATYDDFPVEPDSVYIVESNQLVYQDGLVEARFDRGSALAFQVGLFSLDLDSPYVIDADFLSEEDLADLTRTTSSPAFEAADGTLRLPWLAIFFEGRYRLSLYSVDRNWYDLARSLNFNGTSNIGFGGTAGDTFERPIFHIEGGIGLFGSAAEDDVGFYVHPRP